MVIVPWGEDYSDSDSVGRRYENFRRGIRASPLEIDFHVEIMGISHTC